MFLAAKLLVSIAEFADLKSQFATSSLETTETTGSDLIATVNYHSSILLPWCQPTWTNTLPRHFRRGAANHNPFDFLSSFYTFYMFLGRRSLGEGGYTAMTFSVHRRVRNHYSKRTLNLTLNRKKFFQRENDALDRLIPHC